MRTRCLVFVSLLSACVPRPPPAPAGRPDPPERAAAAIADPLAARPLDPLEAWLVHGGGPDTPMTVVENDSPAGDRLLRTPAAGVAPGDPDLEALAARMRATMEAEGGVGIAAPQVGVLRRAIWVQRQDLEGSPFRFYVNPAIVALDEAREVGWEGCLSIPAGFGEVERALSVTVSWDGAAGTREEETVSGWTARIFQHEIDHLDGVLFVDRTLSEALIDKETYRARRAAAAE